MSCYVLVLCYILTYILRDLIDVFDNVQLWMDYFRTFTEI